MIAASRHLAEDALELIEIDYAPLDAISSIAEAFQPGRPLLWDKAGSNVVYDHSDSYGDVDAVFAAADRVVTERLSCQRQSNQPMETRGSVIEIDAAQASSRSTAPRSRVTCCAGRRPH